MSDVSDRTLARFQDIKDRIKKAEREVAEIKAQRIQAERDAENSIAQLKEMGVDVSKGVKKFDQWCEDRIAEVETALTKIEELVKQVSDGVRDE